MKKFLKLNVLFSLPRSTVRRISHSSTTTAVNRDLGKFAAQFQKKFPHMRLVNLALAPEAAENDGRKYLRFSADVIALVELN